MRNSKRIHEICLQLEELWKQVPDWRFTQLLSNFQICGDRHDGITFYQEDDETLKRIEQSLYELTTL